MSEAPSCPTDDVGVLHTAETLQRLLRAEPEYLKESDLKAFIDAVAARSVFVPTPYDVVEAIRILKFRPANPSYDSMPELERAMRRAQRAPTPIGTSNYLQRRLAIKRRVYPTEYDYIPPAKLPQTCERTDFLRPSRLMRRSIKS